MRVNDICLGVAGAEILLTPIGRQYTEKIIELSRQDRTTSGRLVRDVYAVKKNFAISYSLITGTDLASLVALYNLQTTLSLIVSYERETKKYSVLMDPFDRTRVLAVGEGLWGNVNVTLEEI